MFQQDGAPAHTSRKTQEWLATNLKDFWDKTVWPPSSPDLSPLYYSVWSIVEAKACKAPHSNIDHLKTSIIKAWRSMSKAYLVKTCQQFRPRLDKVLKMEGGIFEK